MEETMNTAEFKIKKAVRERYIAAVTSNNTDCCEKSCCGGTTAIDQSLPDGRVVTAAGYDQKELSALPADTVVNSFGCGNPLAFTEVKPGETVVDIGSGAGIDCLLAARKVGPNGRVIGIDMTPIMIEKAKENAKRAGASNIEFRRGEAESMPIEDTTADWIISNCVINLSPDKPQVFKEAFRVLKPGGRLSITDIMVENLPWILRRSMNLYTSCVAGAISEARYLQGLREAGFSDVQVTERIVYDRDQTINLLKEIELFGGAIRFLRRPLLAILDRSIIGKIWSAKVTARKELD